MFEGDIPVLVVAALPEVVEEIMAVVVAVLVFGVVDVSISVLAVAVLSVVVKEVFPVVLAV